ncbi:centromere protein N-like [Stylophora pistillata]|uniref:Centromere protein N n=1 Tax=Stylophora pistillata TaxID=50429 RepID=A0A2B4S0Y9_STYPI|nr:centromere protein N-like [Stylophora pistillata]PFX22237.1 Centromere protein N [Stylophora pistillata]
MADNPLIKDLCKLFKKFNKEELLEGLIKHGFLKEGVLDTEGTKESFVNRILKKCFDKNVTAEHVALMDLIYHQSHPNCKKWTVYKLVGFDPKKMLNTSEPWKFRSQLKSCLGLYFKVEIYVHLWRNGLWTRIQFCNRSSTSLLSNNVFIIYYPNSEYVFMSTIKAAHKQYIVQTLSTLLHSQTLEEVKLSGRDVPSLKELVLNKSSQGVLSKYRLNQVDGNPLSRKRKREKDRKLEVLQSQEITSENWAEEQKRQQLIDGAFGTNLQPKLERIEFKMQTRLRSRQQFPQLISPISCNVRFEGSSVLEGIKNLGSQSFVDIPLPSYLTNLHSLSRNSLLLKEKKTT